MSTFPALKTGAIMQYPATATIRFFNQSLRFVDGAEQYYRDYRAPLHEWAIRLDLLDEVELKSLEQFFTDQQGQFGTFVFTDPKDNVTYPDCSLMIDDLAFSMDGERRGKTTVIVRENRN
jgi:Conserved hypothetical protein 2217 (DUF2460)